MNQKQKSYQVMSQIQIEDQALKSNPMKKIRNKIKI